MVSRRVVGLSDQAGSWPNAPQQVYIVISLLYVGTEEFTILCFEQLLLPTQTVSQSKLEGVVAARAIGTEASRVDSACP